MVLKESVLSNGQTEEELIVGLYYLPPSLNCDSRQFNEIVDFSGKRKLFTREEKFLLNERLPDLETATSDKWLLLHTLAASGEFDLLDALLKHNVDINAVDQAIVEYLFRESANSFVRDEEGASLMHCAIQTALSRAIKIPLLYNVDINLLDNDGWTRLHLAVQSQRTDVVRLLPIKGDGIRLWKRFSKLRLPDLRAHQTAETGSQVPGVTVLDKFLAASKRDLRK